MSVPSLRPGRTVTLSLLFILAGLLLAGTVRAAAPAPEPAVLNPPSKVAVLGDSMSVATGINIIPGITSPENSWATGSNAPINSVWNRMKALDPAVTRDNRAENGKKMIDVAPQASGLTIDTRLVLIQMGGNDLCRPTVAEMTPVETYRAQLIAGLDMIEEKAPNARVMISSVPDIWNLWFLRGAPNPPNPTPSSRAGTAAIFWDTLAVVPCQSLVKAPSDMSPDAVQRRADVRQRTIDFNNVIQEECSARLNCRTDSGATFQFSSNRPSLWGDILPPEDWEFVDNDISTVDHFHPGATGQEKMARASWESGWDYSDNTPPSRASQTITPAPSGGVNWSPVTAKVTWTDAAGIKGIQYRVHHGGAAGAWQTSLTDWIDPPAWRELYSWPASHSVTVPVSDTGISYVETRAMDASGNLSASGFTEVNINPTNPPAPAIAAGPTGLVNSDSAGFSFSGIPDGTDGAGYECSLDGGAFAACASPLSLTGLGEGEHSLSVRINSGGGTGPAVNRSWTVDTIAPDAPAVGSGPPAATSEGEVTVTFTGEPGGSFECSLDGAAFAACHSPHTVTADGNRGYSLEIRQIDAAGNTGEIVRVNWTHDDVPPAAPALSGIPSGSSDAHSVEATFTGEPGGSFECSLDAAAFAPCTSPHTVDGLTDGGHSSAVRQTDAAGNVGGTATAAWTVKTEDPSGPDTRPDDSPVPPVIGGAPGRFVNSTGVTVSFTGEPGGRFECRLNEGAWEPCTSPWTVRGLGQGRFRLEIRQVNAAGKPGEATAVSWTVDTIAPKLKPRPKLRVKGKVRRGKPVRYLIVSRFVAARGRPATLEFSLRKKKPKKAAKPVRKQVRKWKKKVAVRSKKRPRWVRVADPAGNRSAWVRLR